MKFIRRHTDCTLRTVDNIVFEAMLDYLIERASKIFATYNGDGPLNYEYYKQCEKGVRDKKELNRLLEIIRGAGVDVING